MSPERRLRVVRILRLFALVLVFLIVFVPFALGFATIWILTHTPCGGGRSPADVGMRDYEAVTFPAHDLGRDLHAYFVHGTNGITILIPPAVNTGAGSWREEYTVLNRHGYNLFNYDSRSCAGYANSLGYLEVDEVGDALDYLATRPDVDMNRIGIHGFSAGGATSIMAAARYPQIKAVIAMGGYHDFGQTVEAGTSTEWFAPLYHAGSLLGYRLATGVDMAVLSPVSVIGQIAPRPIQLIYGTREPSLAGAYQQWAAAGPSADLWVIEGAAHGGYWATAPEAFEQRVIAFLSRAFEEVR
ncbi:MAG: prolyl oligopeptidase family serine peptidase [Anaerolineae bacterium]|nr:prolyl oligopeptidase family serine peptidase [Anaerolineae bacterium]